MDVGVARMIAQDTSITKQKMKLLIHHGEKIIQCHAHAGGREKTNACNNLPKGGELQGAVRSALITLLILGWEITSGVTGL